MLLWSKVQVKLWEQEALLLIGENGLEHGVGASQRSSKLPRLGSDAALKADKVAQASHLFKNAMTP